MLAPVHYAWLLLAGVADPAPPLVDTVAEMEMTMSPAPIDPPLSPPRGEGHLLVIYTPDHSD